MDPYSGRESSMPSSVRPSGKELAQEDLEAEEAERERESLIEIHQLARTTMWHPKTPIPKVGGLPSHASHSHTIPWKLRRPVYSTRTLRLPRTPLSLHSVGPEVGLRPPLRTTQTRSSCTYNASFRAYNSPTQCASSYKCLFLRTFRHTPTLLRASPFHPTPCSRHSWHPSTASTPLCAVSPKPTPPLTLGARPLPATGSTVTVRVNLPQC